MRAAGPEGAKVIGELMKCRFPTVMLSFAAITILSGVGLLWIDSDGFAPHWSHYRAAHGYLTGGSLALLAMIIGGTFVRPTVAKIGALGASMASVAAGPEREAKMGELAGLRDRLKIAGRVVAALLALAVTLMAVSRYL